MATSLTQPASDESYFMTMHLSALIEYCHSEMHGFRQHTRTELVPATEGYGDYPACYALFRRAAEAAVNSETRNMAFSAIVEMFGFLIMPWLRGALVAHRQGRQSDGISPVEYAPVNPSVEDYADLVNETQIKIARYVFRPDFASRFNHILPALGYMHATTRSVALEYLRGRRAYAHTTNYDPFDLQRLHDMLQQRDSGSDQQGFESVVFTELWEAIGRSLGNDSRKMTFIRARFVLGLPPREILKRYPGMFKSTGELDELRQSVLDQLRKADSVRAFQLSA